MNTTPSIIICLLLLGMWQTGFTQQENVFFSKADTFFFSNVKNGCLDYSGLKKDPHLIRELVRLISEFSLEGKDPSTRKAFLLNAYNLLVIHSIVSSDLKISSVNEVPGFFSAKRHNVAGQSVSLDELEKDHIFQSFNDERLHFSLICGARSCPRLAAFAFTPEHVESEIIAQCSTTLNDPAFIRSKQDTIELNLIFKWYKGDWGNSTDSILQFINDFRIQKITGNPILAYYPYDWSLNDIDKTDHSIFPQDNTIQLFAPSRLLRKGQWDIKLFNNLYTETSFSDADGIVADIPRNTFFSSQVEIFTGLNKNGTLNAGLITQIRSTVISRSNEDGMVVSPNALEALLFRNDGFQRRSAWATLAPVIKWAPFSKVTGLSLLSAFHVPLVSEPESPIFLTFNSYIWDNRILYDMLMGIEDNWQLYGELGFQFTFGKREAGFANNSLFVPLTVVTSYFMNQSFTFYALAQHGERIGQGAQNYTQAGLGIKWQWTDRLQIEGLFSQFLRAKSSGLGSSYNIGLRYLYL